MTRGVAVPAVDIGAAVDRDDVARLEHARARDAVHDLVVDRGADRVAVAAYELEVGASRRGDDDRVGERVQLAPS